MKTRSIILKEPELNLLELGRRITIQREIKPQPDGLRRGISTLQSLRGSNEWAEYYYNGDGVVDFVACSYGAEGDELWVKESWLVHFGEVIYRAAYDLQAHEEGVADWQSPSSMPRKYARMMVKIEDVAVVRGIEPNAPWYWSITLWRLTI